MTFEWDVQKAKTNLEKHGIRFEEAASVFFDARALEMPDPEHSLKEQRTILLGYSNIPRLLVVVFTVRNSSIRIISARLASRKERIEYEKTTL
jgi:hypothetical protein